MSDSTKHTLLDTISGHEETLAVLHAQDEALQASIQPQRDAIKAKEAEIRGQFAETVIGALLSDEARDLLADPVTAMEIYRLGWDYGRGMDGFEEALVAAIDSPLIRFTDVLWDDFQSTSLTLPVLRLRIDKDTTDDQIADLTAKIGPVFDALDEIVGDGRRRKAYLELSKSLNSDYTDPEKVRIDKNVVVDGETHPYRVYVAKFMTDRTEFTTDDLETALLFVRDTRAGKRGYRTWA